MKSGDQYLQNNTQLQFFCKNTTQTSGIHVTEMHIKMFTECMFNNCLPKHFKTSISFKLHLHEIII